MRDRINFKAPSGSLPQEKEFVTNDPNDVLPSGLSVPSRSALQEVLERKNLMKSQADGMSRLDKLQYELKMKSVALQD